MPRSASSRPSGDRTWPIADEMRFDASTFAVINEEDACSQMSWQPV
jgi:hypothetical protein